MTGGAKTNQEGCSLWHKLNLALIKEIKFGVN